MGKKKLIPSCIYCNDPNKTAKDFYSINKSRCKDCYSEYKREHPYDQSPHDWWKVHIKRTYRITEQDYNTLLQEQGGVCASCGKPETVFDLRTNSLRKLSIDHCHTTDAVRGLLCNGCNQALGYLREDPERIKALLKYVEDRCQW